MDARAANQDFHFGTDFMKKSGRFQSALATTDDDYSLISKVGKIRPFGGMCCEFP